MSVNKGINRSSENHRIKQDLCAGNKRLAGARVASRKEWKEESGNKVRSCVNATDHRYRLRAKTTNLRLINRETRRGIRASHRSPLGSANNGEQNRKDTRLSSDTSSIELPAIKLAKGRRNHFQRRAGTQSGRPRAPLRHLHARHSRAARSQSSVSGTCSFPSSLPPSRPALQSEHRTASSERHVALRLATLALLDLDHTDT